MNSIIDEETLTAIKANEDLWQNILFYKEWAKILLTLPAELRAKIHDAVDEFIVSRTDPTDNSILYSPYWMIRQRILQDKHNYQEKIIVRNRANGNKGGRPRKTQETQSHPNNPVGFEKPSGGEETQWGPEKPNRKRNMIDTSNDVSQKESQKKGFSETIERRKQLFAESIAPFVEEYGRDMCNAFFSYWTEPNKSGTRMRWELEKTWDVNRRLKRWTNNNFKK